MGNHTATRARGRGGRPASEAGATPAAAPAPKTGMDPELHDLRTLRSGYTRSMGRLEKSMAAERTTLAAMRRDDPLRTVHEQHLMRMQMQYGRYQYQRQAVDEDLARYAAAHPTPPRAARAGQRAGQRTRSTRQSRALDRMTAYHDELPRRMGVGTDPHTANAFDREMARYRMGDLTAPKPTPAPERETTEAKTNRLRDNHATYWMWLRNGPGTELKPGTPAYEKAQAHMRDLNRASNTGQDIAPRPRASMPSGSRSGSTRARTRTKKSA